MGPVESLCSSELYSLEETTANFCKGLDQGYLKDKFCESLIHKTSRLIFSLNFRNILQFLLTDKNESRFKYHLTNFLRINFMY